MLQILTTSYTAWKVSKYGGISGPYFPAFGLNMEIYSVNLRIPSEYRKIRTRNNSVFGYFSHNAMLILYRLSRSKGLSCFMQFAKECNYFRVICLFFWHFIKNKRLTRSSCFLLSFYLRILFHTVFFVSCLFLLQQDFVNCRYSANLKILKANVNMTATGLESTSILFVNEHSTI